MPKFDWYASDFHFKHQRIIEFGRPFLDVSDHDEQLIKAWNDRVMPDDKCLILGDLAFNVGVPTMGRLNGKLWLLMGNHEHKPIQDYLPYFQDIKAYAEEKGIGVLFSHIPVHESQLSRWKANVHGHTHAFNLPDKRYVNISLEQTDYKPLSREELLRRLP